MNLNYLRFLLFVIILLLPGIHVNSQVIYLSPLPDSKFNNPNTNIIIKLKDKIINPDEIDRQFQIQGTGSENYSYKYRLTDNGRTILLKTEKPFNSFENIKVKLTDTLFTINKEITGFEFQFRVSQNFTKNSLSEANKSYSDKNLLGEIPSNFPTINITTKDNPANGKIFLYNVSSYATNNDRYLSIIDNNGIPEYWRQESNTGLNFMLQPSGFLSFWNNDNFVLMDSTYSVIDTIGCQNGYTADFHEFIHLKNGHSFLLSWDRQIVDLSQYGGDPEAQVEGLVIQELDEKKDVVFQWRSWDHFKITDAVDIDLTTSVVSYVHGNGLDTTSDGNLLLSSRLLNEITKINRTTGEIIWRLGGKNNQFNFVNDPEMFCRQHHIQELDNGNITIYDNGSCHSPQISTAKEYKLDTLNKTAELVWSYHHPNNMYCSTMGNAQRLENGNTFINWGLIENPDLPSITEVRPDGSIAFEMNFGGQFQLIYRSFRFNWDNKYYTSVTNFKNQENHLELFPNPAKSILNVKPVDGFPPKSRICIVDLNGKTVYNQYFEGTTSNQTISINIRSLKEGIYFLTTGNSKLQRSKMFIKINEY